VKGVEVDRDVPDIYNGITWRVTFLDDSPSGTNNFKLTSYWNNVTLQSGNTAGLSVTKLHDGEKYSTCTGTHEVPKDKVLSNGQYYYARVFAINDVGYSLPQNSQTSQKPQVAPGAPTSVSLSVFSSSALILTFNPPASDGGDAITAYKVEYSTSSSFSSSQSVLFTSLSSGAPYQKIIQGLTMGVYVYVKVSAMNSQGYGTTTLSTPSSLNPYTKSNGPTNVLLYPTSSTMLTVSFGLPTSNGGDTVTGYRVEWDTAANFNGPLSSPHKGYYDVDASVSSSYTIQYLNTNQVYYVRVYARNSAGLGTPTLSSPSYSQPSLQVPGKPHTITATTGDSAGEIKLSWQYPRIPWHGIPCSGLTSSPSDCPTPVGGGLASSTGGSVITEYEISFNELVDFTGFDSGKFITTSSTTQYTLTNLTPGRVYYIRVLARNAQGAGQFCGFVESNCLLVSSHVSAEAMAVIA